MSTLHEPSHLALRSQRPLQRTACRCRAQEVRFDEAEACSASETFVWILRVMVSTSEFRRSTMISFAAIFYQCIFNVAQPLFLSWLLEQDIPNLTNTQLAWSFGGRCC